jgi:hypothetical protein
MPPCVAPDAEVSSNYDESQEKLQFLIVALGSGQGQSRSALVANTFFLFAKREQGAP